MMHALDWHSIKQAVYEKAKEVIEGFAEEHPEVRCSFFACYADPFSGTFTFSFDIPENAAYEAMKHELMILKRRQTSYEQLGWTDAWRQARSSVNLPLESYPHTSAFFQYASYATLELDWYDIADRHASPQRGEGEDNYFEGQTRWMLCRVMDRLVADRVFEQLAMTSPFRLGYEFHEEAITVLRLLNWPATGGKTIYSVLDIPPEEGEQQRAWHTIGIEEYARWERSNDAPAQPDSPSHASSVSSSSSIRIHAYPSTLEEHPWSREITLTLDVGEIATEVEIRWPHVRVDLDGLGSVELFPTLLAIHLEEAVKAASLPTLVLCDYTRRELEPLAWGSSREYAVSLFAEQICVLKMRRASDAFSQSITVHVKLHTFRASCWLPSRNLWWLKNEEGRRLWQENRLEYPDPQFLVEDLNGSLERLIAEAGVIGYEPRRRKLAIILFALGRVAQAAEAYPQAVQLYAKSQQKFQSLHDLVATENALLLLQEVYLRQGKKEQAARAASQLFRLRSSM